MTRANITDVINSRVAEKALCWCDGRNARMARAKNPLDCWEPDAEDAMKLRFYTDTVSTSCWLQNQKALALANAFEDLLVTVSRGALRTLRRNHRPHWLLERCLVGHDGQDVGLHLVPLLNYQPLGLEHAAD